MRSQQQEGRAIFAYNARSRRERSGLSKQLCNLERVGQYLEALDFVAVPAPDVHHRRLGGLVPFFTSV